MISLRATAMADPDQPFDQSGSRYGQWAGDPGDFADSFIDADIEHAAACTAAGDQVYHIEGLADRVHLPMSHAPDLSGGTLIHNHPHSARPTEALSPADLWTAFRLNLRNLVTVTRIAGRRRAVILERISDQWTLAGQSVLVTKYAEFLSDARRDLPARALRAVSTGDAQTASELLAEPVYHTTLAAMQDLADYYECFSVREVLFDE